MSIETKTTTAEIERKNGEVRKGFRSYVTETTGLGRISQEHAYLAQLVDFIPTYPTKLSLIEVGIGSSPHGVYRSTYTPWFLWGFLNSRVCHPQLTIVEQNQNFIDQLQESLVFANTHAIRTSQDYARAWSAMQCYLGQPSYEIETGCKQYSGRDQVLSGIATPAGFQGYPWVQVMHADASTIQPEQPLNADIVFARYVAYQMSEEAQKLFIQNVRKHYMGKPGSFLVVTDCVKQGDYKQALFKENKGWLDVKDLSHLGYRLMRKYHIGGVQTTWTDYILQSV